MREREEVVREREEVVRKREEVVREREEMVREREVVREREEVVREREEVVREREEVVREREEVVSERVAAGWSESKPQPHPTPIKMKLVCGEPNTCTNTASCVFYTHIHMQIHVLVHHTCTPFHLSCIHEMQHLQATPIFMATPPLPGSVA